MKKIVNNVEIEMTADEITALKTEQATTKTEINLEKQKIQDAITKKASGKQKLLDLGLSEEEVKALIGV
jgi:hypothetical protein